MSNTNKAECNECNGTQTVLIATILNNKETDLCFGCYAKHYGKERALRFFQDMPEDWKV